MQNIDISRKAMKCNIVIEILKEHYCVCVCVHVEVWVPMFVYFYMGYTYIYMCVYMMCMYMNVHDKETLVKHIYATSG